MSKRYNILPTRTSFFTSSAVKFESVQENPNLGGLSRDSFLGLERDKSTPRCPTQSRTR